MSRLGCHVPRTFMRRCGTVWCCSCGRFWILGYSYDMLTKRKAWVPLDEVQRLAAVRGES